MRSTTGGAGCVTASISGFARVMLLMYWIARPGQMELAFNTFIVPCLGFMILPFTTLMYVWLMQGVGASIQGLDWLWLLLAVLMDLASLAGAGYTNRNRLPGGSTGDLAP